jgi:hypothetical protein
MRDPRKASCRSTAQGVNRWLTSRRCSLWAGSSSAMVFDSSMAMLAR